MRETMIYAQTKLYRNCCKAKSFEIQINYSIQARKPDLIIMKKEWKKVSDFAAPVEYRVKLKESEKKKNVTGCGLKTVTSKKT